MLNDNINYIFSAGAQIESISPTQNYLATYFYSSFSSFSSSSFFKLLCQLILFFFLLLLLLLLLFYSSSFLTISSYSSSSSYNIILLLQFLLCILPKSLPTTTSSHLSPPPPPVTPDNPLYIYLACVKQCCLVTQYIQARLTSILRSEQMCHILENIVQYSHSTLLQTSLDKDWGIPFNKGLYLNNIIFFWQF